MTADALAPWVRRTRPEAAARLLLFPPAGTGASAFRGWADAMPADVDVCVVILPGREHRMGEPAPATWGPWVGALAAAIAPTLRRTPTALYGHSMGAFVAFEVARELRRARRPLPDHLFVGARHAPHLAPRLAPLSHLPDEAFVDAVHARYQAIPEALRRDAGLMRLFLPTLRADFQLLDGYVLREEPPLDLPITAFRGQRDALVDPADVEAWGAHTTRAFRAHTLPGGHFFQDEDRDLLASWIASAWSR